jgi:hypothetical protein
VGVPTRRVVSTGTVYEVYVLDAVGITISAIGVIFILKIRRKKYLKFILDTIVSGKRASQEKEAIQ